MIVGWRHRWIRLVKPVMLIFGWLIPGYSHCGCCCSGEEQGANFSGGRINRDYYRAITRVITPAQAFKCCGPVSGVIISAEIIASL